MIPAALSDVRLNEVLSDEDMLKRMLEFIRPAQTAVVLDLGTGQAHTAMALAPHVQRVMAVDCNYGVIQAARENVRKHTLEAKIEVQKGFADSLEFGDAQFDLVTCRAAFHHFPNPMAVLSEVHRVLKRTGIFYLMDPIFSDHAKQIWTPLARVRELDLNSFYTYLDQMEMLRAGGFQVAKLRPFLFPRELDSWIASAAEAIQERLREVVLSLDERVKKELHFAKMDGKWRWYYNVYELLACKTET
jgi:ubiquinone/menaquinone biosynthesis C-methylase UbiE